MTTEKCKRSEAIGAKCRGCDAIFTADRCPYWAWTKSEWMHTNAMGHKFDYFRIVK
jgi:hypothetical protein